jgi:hypothetical protein
MPYTGFGIGSGSSYGSGYRSRSGSGSGSRQYLAQFSNNKNVDKICLFNVRSSIIFQKVGFSFLIRLFYEMLFLGPDPNPVQEPKPKCIPVPVSLRQKVTVPAISVPVPQHCFSHSVFSVFSCFWLRSSQVVDEI